MALTNRTKLGPYEILSPLGAGGMGEVYRARDTKLNREVALKVLPEAFAANAERMARFEREAQVLASLNHPNIASIYGLEESNGVRALVMELVEGRTLADRIAQGPIAIDEALLLAKQIAEGLEYAHEKGIIHRDLKPANVKVTPDGAVKVLDFGLAKALAPEVSGTNLANSPTISIAATQAGVILGTAAYMSPEQAKGKTVDRRTDIWAFGCVLYEMLCGKKPFDGETATEVLAAVVIRDPDWSKLPEMTPSRVRDLIRRCLIKEPKQRLRDIGEARITIEDSSIGSAEVEAGLPRQAKRGDLKSLLLRALPWLLAAISTLLAAALTISSALHTARPSTRQVARFPVTLPAGDHLAIVNTPVLALSPDGSRLVYVANHSGTTQLYLRSIDRLEAVPIPGTEGAEAPFFSPDGQSVGFFAEGKLKKTSLSGGAPFVLCNAPLNRGASWGPDDNIIFTPAAAVSGLLEVAAAGGTPKPLTIPNRSREETSHRWPEILPGGKAVLFTMWLGGSFDNARIALLSLATGEQRVLIEGGTYARYVPSGHLVYARAGGLLAVPFDLKRLEVTGPPVSVFEGVSTTSLSGVAQFSLSGDGSLAYAPGQPSLNGRTLLWVDRKGVSQTLPAPARAYMSPRLSPDGQRLAVAIQGTNPGVWLYELARGTLTRLESSAINGSPSWTPDGKRVAFSSALRAGVLNIYWIAADGSGPAESLTTSENMQFPYSWSLDGRTLAFSEVDPATGWHIWMLNLVGERKPSLFNQTSANEGAAMFSPDGHWLAYESDESGRHEIYVRSFPGAGGKVQISTDGGTEPVWARNGKELFYRNGDRMMAAAVETKPVFAAAKPKLLFEGHYETAAYSFLPNYDVSPDGQRFLMIKESEQESAATQINVVLNWFEELKRRAPTEKK